MARRVVPQAQAVEVPDGVPAHLLEHYGISMEEQLSRARGRDSWYARLGLGDRRAHPGERKRLHRLGLDRIGARFEDPRLWMMRDLQEIPLPDSVVTTHERHTAEGELREGFEHRRF